MRLPELVIQPGMLNSRVRSVFVVIGTEGAPSPKRRTAAEVVGERVQHEPGGVGREAPRGEMVEADAVLEVTDYVLDDCVAPVVCLELEGSALPVGRDRAGAQCRHH